MLIRKQQVTTEEFYQFVTQHSDRVYERIEGEIVEKMPSFGRSSAVGARLTTLVGIHLLTNPIAHLTDAQGGYDIDDEDTFAPDIGVILKSRLSQLPVDRFIPLAPDFVIEVVSQSDLKDPHNRIEKKLHKYQAVGVSLIWYVYPERREVEVFRQGHSVQVATVEDMLDGADVLPDLSIRVHDIFPD